MITITRPLKAHAYAAGGPAAPAPAHSHVIVHKPGPRQPAPGMTPVCQGQTSMWAADGAPFYNSGYVYPAYGPLITGGSASLLLPGHYQVSQNGTVIVGPWLDLTDTTTWDRPVWFQDAR